jgi:hypothetical protein
MQHIDPETLERYLLNHSSELEQEIIEEHLLICGECIDSLNQMEIEIKVIKEALRNSKEQSDSATGTDD